MDQQPAEFLSPAVEQPQKLPPASTLLRNAIHTYRIMFWIFAPISLAVFCGGLVQIIASLSNNIVINLLGFLVNIIISFLSYMAFILAIGNPADGALPLSGLYKKSWKSIAAYTWVSLFVVMATIGGFILFIIPGIMVAVFVSLSIYIFIEEGDRGISALVKSWHYVKGRWWQVAWKIIYLTVILALISLGLSLVIFILKVAASGGVGPLVQSVQNGTYQDSLGGAIIDNALTAFVATPLTLIYFYGLYHVLRALRPLPIPEVEERRIKTTIKIFSIIAIVAVVAGFIAAGFEATRLGPEMIQNTTMPAAASAPSSI